MSLPGKNGFKLLAVSCMSFLETLKTPGRTSTLAVSLGAAAGQGGAPGTSSVVAFLGKTLPFLSMLLVMFPTQFVSSIKMKP